MKSFIKRFQNFIFQKKLFKRGDKIIVGISGGPDSTFLTLALNEIKDSYDLRLILVHINYELRGEDSAEDEQFVRRLSGKLKLPLRVEYYQKRKEQKGNLEEAMRNFRYDFFEQERKKEKFNWVAVGHTLDDQVETFFMNLFRGSGIEGLNSLREKRDKIIRPLIGFEKRELIKQLKKEKQEYRIDKSNQDKKLFRNSIRLELIPLIEKKYNPQVKKRIASLTNQLNGIEQLIKIKAEKEYRQIINKKTEKTLELNLNEFKIKSEVIQGEIFRKIIMELKGDMRNVSYNNFLEFKKIVISHKAKRQKIIMGKLLINRIGDRVVFNYHK